MHTTLHTTVQFKTVSMRSEKLVPSSLSEFPNVAFKTVLMFVLLTSGFLSSLPTGSSSASSFHTPQLHTIDGVMSLGFVPHNDDVDDTYTRTHCQCKHLDVLDDVLNCSIWKRLYQICVQKDNFPVLTEYKLQSERSWTEKQIHIKRAA